MIQVACRWPLQLFHDNWIDVDSLILREMSRFSSGFGHVVRCLLGVGLNGEPVLLSTVPDGSEVSRWDVETGGRVWRDDEGMSGCNDEALVRLPDGGQALAIATEDGIEWWNALTGQRWPELTWDGWTIWAVAEGVSSTGRAVLLGAGHDSVVYRWDPVTGQPLGGAESKGRGIMTAVGFVPLLDDAGVAVSGDEGESCGDGIRAVGSRWVSRSRRTIPKSP